MTTPISSPRILIVEDDVDLRQIYTESLTDAGFNVENAADGLLGYQKLVDGGYDVVLLDLMLPKLNGIDILIKLKAAHPKLPNKAIIVLSNIDQEPVLQQAIREGATTYLIKSNYTPGQIVDIVKQWLSQ